MSAKQPTHADHCRAILAGAITRELPLAFAGQAILTYHRKHDLPEPVDPFLFASGGLISMADAFEYDRENIDRSVAAVAALLATKH